MHQGPLFLFTALLCGSVGIVGCGRSSLLGELQSLEPAAPAPDAGITSADAAVSMDAGTASPDASSSTDAGMPGVTSDGGDEASAPAPPPPRAIAPLSTSRVTRRSPTLRWTLPEGVTGATVELCRDRACTNPIMSPVLVAGTAYTPLAPLPTGTIFWRLHPGTTMDVTSPTWQFTVGAADTATDVSWGTTLDVNGDGYSDLVVGAWGESNGSGAAHVYVGGAHGLATSSLTTLPAPPGASSFGYSVASAGDVDGDGYSDLVVGAPAILPSNGPGLAFLYSGGPTGLPAAPALALSPPDALGGAFGVVVTSAGDVNGDGYADLAVSACDESSNVGRVFLYLGSATGLGPLPAATLLGPAAGSAFGFAVAGIGDVDADGFADLAVGGFRGNDVYVYRGSASGLAPQPATMLVGSPADDYFGISLAGAGDVNGDGYADLVVGDPALASVYFYAGGPGGLTNTPAATLTYGWGNEFASAVAAAGDLNGDGYADLVIGAPEDGGPDVYSTGDAHVYLGGPGGPALEATIVVSPADARAYFSAAVASAGDVNGDGYADLAIGAWGTASAYVYLGGAEGLGTPYPSPPASTLGGAGGESAYFGFALFGASD